MQGVEVDIVGLYSGVPYIFIAGDVARSLDVEVYVMLVDRGVDSGVAIGQMRFGVYVIVFIIKIFYRGYPCEASSEVAGLKRSNPLPLAEMSAVTSPTPRSFMKAFTGNLLAFSPSA